MAQRKRADDDQDDTLELTPDMEMDEPPEDEPGDDEPDDEGDEADGGEAPADDDRPPMKAMRAGKPSLALRDDQAAADDNAVIRRIRDRNRDLAKENAELRRAQAAQPPPIELGPKPTLADADYDEDRFEAELDAWKDRKARIDSVQAEQQAEAATANREWQRDLEAHVFPAQRPGHARF